MKNQKKQQLENLRIALAEMDSDINKLVIAEDENVVLKALTYKDPSKLIAMLISAMEDHQELANVINLAAKGFQKISPNSSSDKKETSIADFKMALEKLPKGHRVFSVVHDGEGIMIIASGNPVKISSDLCLAQEKDETLRLIMQSAVDVYRSVSDSSSFNRS